MSTARRPYTPPTVRRLGVVEVLPGQGTSKARLMAQLDEMRRRIERLPEPACVLIEESGIVAGVVRHLGTAGNVTGHISAIASSLFETLGAVGRAAEASGLKFTPPARARRGR